MVPAKLDITVYQGATLYYPFQWLEGRTPLDITGYRFRMQIREKIEDTTPIVTASSETGEFYLGDPLQGEWFLEIPASVTQEFDFSHGVYDIECIYPDGRVFRVLQGRAMLSKEVTR